MSKKIAEGIGGLVLDVKTGGGAFMKTLEDSRALAQSLVAIGKASGVRTEALITRMDAPLGREVGNAHEVIECIETLKGQGPADLEYLSVLLAARMLVLAGVAATTGRRRGIASAGRSPRGAASRPSGASSSTRAAIRGSSTTTGACRRAPDEHRVAAPRSGTVTSLDAESVGRAAVALGAGRGTLDDAVDPAVGITVVAPPGAAVAAGDPVLDPAPSRRPGPRRGPAAARRGDRHRRRPVRRAGARGRGNPRLTNGAENR